MATTRRYPIPAGYPVPAEHIPDMPIDHYHLLAFGELTPLLCRAMRVKVMGCAYCGEDMTWAGTAELDLFHEDDPGCMRWGLCETSPAAKEGSR